MLGRDGGEGAVAARERFERLHRCRKLCDESLCIVEFGIRQVGARIGAMQAGSFATRTPSSTRRPASAS